MRRRSIRDPPVTIRPLRLPAPPTGTPPSTARVDARTGSARAGPLVTGHTSRAGRDHDAGPPPRRAAPPSIPRAAPPSAPSADRGPRGGGDCRPGRGEADSGMLPGPCRTGQHVTPGRRGNGCEARERVGGAGTCGTGSSCLARRASAGRLCVAHRARASPRTRRAHPRAHLRRAARGPRRENRGTPLHGGREPGAPGAVAAARQLPNSRTSSSPGVIRRALRARVRPQKAGRRGARRPMGPARCPAQRAGRVRGPGRHEPCAVSGAGRAKGAGCPAPRPSPHREGPPRSAVPGRSEPPAAKRPSAIGRNRRGRESSPPRPLHASRRAVRQSSAA